MFLTWQIYVYSPSALYNKSIKSIKNILERTFRNNCRIAQLLQLLTKFSTKSCFIQLHLSLIDFQICFTLHAVAACVWHKTSSYIFSTTRTGLLSALTNTLNFSRNKFFRIKIFYCQTLAIFIISMDILGFNKTSSKRYSLRFTNKSMLHEPMLKSNCRIHGRVE